MRLETKNQPAGWCFAQQGWTRRLDGAVHVADQ
jgi:hypothetical protein